VDGVEVEGAYLLNAQNRFDGSVTWMDATYEKWLIPTGPSAANPQNVDFSGQHLDRSPEFTATFGYSHTTPLSNGGDVVAAFHTKWTDKYALISTALRAQFWQPSYSATDLTLTYNAPGHKWYLQGYAKNIEDNVAVTSVSVSGRSGTANISDPRPYGVRFGAKF
jgi:iron complex outermembrane receptor protein